VTKFKWTADFDRYIDTPLLDNLEKGKLTQVFDFALAEDAVKAVLKVATDKTVNGKFSFFIGKRNDCQVTNTSQEDHLASYQEVQFLEVYSI
jgi:hypothetical protein